MVDQFIAGLVFTSIVFFIGYWLGYKHEKEDNKENLND